MSITKKIIAKPTFDVVAIGSSVRDMSFYSDEFYVIDNPVRDAQVKKFIAAEYGAKVRSENVHIQAGGGAANTATNFVGLGLTTALIACVGDDEDGDMLAREFEKKGIDTRFMTRSHSKRTGFSFIAMHPDHHDRTALIYYGANQDLEVPAATIHKLRTQWFYVASLNTTAWPQLLKMIAAHPTAKLAWNPGGRQLQASKRVLLPLLKKTEILIVNKDEAMDIAVLFGFMKKGGNEPKMEKLAIDIQEMGPNIVVITDGRNGSVAYDGDDVTIQRAPKDKPADTTGAGDCFGSTFVGGMIHTNGDIPAAMRLAQINATSLVKKVGAQQGLLPWKQLAARARVKSVLHKK